MKIPLESSANTMNFPAGTRGGRGRAGLFLRALERAQGVPLEFLIFE